MRYVHLSLVTVALARNEATPRMDNTWVFYSSLWRPIKNQWIYVTIPPSIYMTHNFPDSNNINKYEGGYKTAFATRMQWRSEGGWGGGAGGGHVSPGAGV